MTAPRVLSSFFAIFSISRRISSGRRIEQTCFFTSSPSLLGVQGVHRVQFDCRKAGFVCQGGKLGEIWTRGFCNNQGKEGESLRSFYFRELLGRGKFYFSFTVIIGLVSFLSLFLTPAWSDSPVQSAAQTKQGVQQKNKVEKPSPPSFQQVTTFMAIISPFLAIFGTILGVKFGARLTTKREELKERKRKLHSLQAMKVELQTVWKAYMNGPGNDLEIREKQPSNNTSVMPLGRYPEVSDLYFSIYQRNSEIIGALDDPNLAEKIIIAYQRMSGIFKTLELNNKFWEEGFKTPEIFSPPGTEPSVSIKTLVTFRAKQGFEDRLNDLANKLADLHKKMSPEMKILFNEMESYIKKHDC